MSTRRRRATMALGAAGLIVAGGGGIATATTAPPTSAGGTGAVDYMWTPNPDVLAGAEGDVNIIAWAGYVEDGSTDPAVDWVTPFEDITGCAVNTKIGNTSDEMVQLMQSGEYDGVSASGDATERLMAGDEVDRDRRRRVHELPADLRRPEAAAVELARRRAVRHPARSRRQPAGVQHRHVRRRRARLVERDVRRRHAGRRRDLGVRQPDLHRRRRGVPDGHPARPRHHQPVRPRRRPARRRDRAARGAEAAHRPVLVGVHRPADRARGRHRARRHDVAGTSSTWPRPTAPRSTRVKPVEGATGWSDTWMLSSKAAHPNCMKLWMDWITSPWANAQVAEWFGEAPSNRDSCELTANPDHCDDLPRRRDRLLDGRLVLDHADVGVPRRPHRRRVHARTRSGSTPGTRCARSRVTTPIVQTAGGTAPRSPQRTAGPVRAVNRLFRRSRALSAGALVGPAVLWLVVDLRRVAAAADRGRRLQDRRLHVPDHE